MIRQLRSALTFWNLFISLVIVAIITLLLFVLISHSNPSSNIPVVAVTPTPIFYQWKEYADNNQHYYLPVPPSWTVPSTTPGNRETEFSFTDNGKQYAFSIAVGNVIPDASLTQVDSKQQQTILYGGKSFLKIVWIRNTIPFLVIAIPNDPNFHFYAFSMDIPPSDPKKYLGMFDQIMNKLIVEKTLEGISVSPVETP